MRIWTIAFLGATALVATAGSATAQSHAGHAEHARVCPDPRLEARRDSGFAAMQKRGEQAMGVDQYTTQHRFESLPDGGRIVYESQNNVAAEVAQIRKHLSEVATAFAAGDFSTPAFVHGETVPGADVMSARRAQIEYNVINRPFGAAVHIRTSDQAALHAIHEFLAYQRKEHC